MFEKAANKDRPKKVTLISSKQPFLSAYHAEISIESNIPGFRSCSSQTEISTLLIRPDFSKIEPDNDTKTKIAKYNGEFILHSHLVSSQQSLFDRLKQYCKDLDAGKEITVFESDLSDELKAEFDRKPSVTANTVKIEKTYNNQSTDTYDLSNGSQSRSIDDIGLIHKEIFAQLESKMKSTLNFEIDAAIKKSTESFKNLQVTCNCPDKDQLQETKQQLGEKELKINQLDHELILLRNGNKRFQTMLSERDITITEQNKKSIAKNLEFQTQLKEKESEIAKLQKKVADQTNTNHKQQIAMNAKCKEIENLKKTSSQQNSQVEVNKLKSKIGHVLKLALVLRFFQILRI